MELVVNGKSVDTDPGQTVAGLLMQFELANAVVAVEVNEDLVPKRDHERHVLNPQDHVEIVTLVGGG